MTRQFEINEEYRSRSRRRDPSVPVPPSVPPPPPPLPRDFSPEYYINGPVHVIETEAVPPMALSPPYPLSPRDSAGALQPPPVPRGRPRSVPPLSTAIISRRLRSRSRSRSLSSSDGDDDYDRDFHRGKRGVVRSKEPKSPIHKAGDVLKDKFSESTMGLGVGLLGAAVGAYIAHEASDAHDRYRNGKEYDGYEPAAHRPPRDSPKEPSNKSKIALTVLGAMVGGLGANAIERQFEDARERDRDRRTEWERKRRYNGNDGEFRLDRRGGGYDGRSRSRGREKVSEVVEVRRGRHYRRHGDEAEEEEDYTYEETKPRRGRSEDDAGYRYRD